MFPERSAAESYHFFGNLWLEPPELHLDENGLAQLGKLRPYIEQLSSRLEVQNLSEAGSRGDWAYLDEFERLVEAEAAAWARLGVSRESAFMIPPSGHLDARIACHLHCPSFSVSDPYNCVTADETNICIKQILDVGFTADRCLIFDHLARREALDGFQFYPPEILQLHESFTTKLRKHMLAAVEICWGSHVRKRMMQTSCLTPLKLWGEHKEVQIWLEWEKDHNQPSDSSWFLVRFVVFVQHPQRMLYGSRLTRGVFQDRHLTVATKLAKTFSIDEHFYESTHKPGTYGRLASWQYKRQQSLNASSVDEVSACISAASDLGIGSGSAADWSLPSDFSEFRLLFETETEQTPPADQDSLISLGSPPQAAKESTKLVPELAYTEEAKGLAFLASSIISGGASLDAALLICGLSDSEVNTDSLLYGWGDVPFELRQWLQAQEGLRINRESITTTNGLLRVHALLCRKQSKLFLRSSGIVKIALDVAIRYFKQVELIGRDKSTIADLTVDGEPPRHVMPRKCALCGDQILDDAQSRYKKNDPQRYILRFLQNGCGQSSCPGNQQGTWAIPLDPLVRYVRPDRDKLVRNPMKPSWEEYFLLPTGDTHELARKVTIVCRGCRKAEFEDTKPRWTRGSQPCYVLRRPRCNVCNSKNKNWEAQDKSIKSVDSSKLSRKWANLTKQPSFDASDVLKNPDWYLW